MKIKLFLLIALTFAAANITGCGYTKPVSYSFAEDGNENGTVKITFVKYGKIGVRLVDCEDVTMPSPAPGTNWRSAVIFPAEKSLNIRVYVYWNEDRYGERRRGIFRCPPLEADREYKLWFTGDYKNGGSLVLTYSNAVNPKSEIVYEQVIPPPPQ